MKTQAAAQVLDCHAVITVPERQEGIVLKGDPVPTDRLAKDDGKTGAAVKLHHHYAA